jgi:hypothetical protein
VVLAHEGDHLAIELAFDDSHQLRPVLAGYCDAVADRIKAGEPFGYVEDAIDKVDDLSQDEKAAVWLFAFSLRGPAEQQLDARAHLYALG